jgi:molybdopterin converting factor small subunit
MIQVYLPSQLESYTDGVRQVTFDMENDSALTLASVIRKLDEKYHGIAFRIVDEQHQIRRHIAIFVGEQLIRELDFPLDDEARVQIVGALSGG